jgi:hypothetical protein
MTPNEKRYRDAMHAVQSGVAMEMNFDPGPTSTKHLRVGVNSAMVQHGALVRLLVDKGFITWAEVWKELADEAEREQARYEADLSARLGTKITLA